MILIEQSWVFEQHPVFPLEILERIGRTCYHSEDKIQTGSAIKFSKMLLSKGHESVIEHVSASVRFITNRGVTHELVRHRLCSFSQESTRYVDFSKEIEIIKPVWWEEADDGQKVLFEYAMRESESSYRGLRAMGWRPEQAREVLPNALKTEIVVTANLREWRHIFRLRTAPAAHPQMRSLMVSCLAGFQETIPILFDELGV